MDCEVLIVGSGMVGSTLAAALAREGVECIVIDSHAPVLSWPTESTDIRVSAITLASVAIFRALRVWNNMIELRVCPFREMHVWDSQGSGAIHFDSAELALAELGYIVENRVIQSTLIKALEALDAIQTRYPAELVSIERQDEHTVATLADGTTLSARLLVGADGGNSIVRRLNGITTHGWSYEQQALVTTVRPEYSHCHTAWQRFLPNGPLAFLPLNDNLCSIVWSTLPDHARSLLELDETVFTRELENAFEMKLGQIELAGPRASFPLRMRHADRYVDQRLALIGDAAHTIHPLAGQGVNLGLLDAAALAEVIVDARQRRRDIGAYATLRKYERWRKGDNMLMMAAMDGFKRLFSNDIGPLCMLRNLGLSLTNQLGPVKNIFMRHAAGLRGDLPKLASPSYTSD